MEPCKNRPWIPLKDRFLNLLIILNLCAENYVLLLARFEIKIILQIVFLELNGLQNITSSRYWPITLWRIEDNYSFFKLLNKTLAYQAIMYKLSQKLSICPKYWLSALINRIISINHIDLLHSICAILNLWHYIWNMPINK